MIRRARGLAAALGIAGLAIAAASAPAQEDGLAPSTSGAAPASALGAAVPMRAAVTPVLPLPRLGEALEYRGWIAVHPGITVRWSAPDRSGDLVWGPVRTGRVPRPGAEPPADSVWVSVPLQVFATGRVTVPGLGFRLESGGGVRAGRLPVVRLHVSPTVAASDSNARLRPPRGPIAAPWWERVAWAWVAGAVLAVAAAVVLWRRLRRRRPAPSPAAAPAVARRRDPAAEALAELAALRRRELPAAGRFAEHAFLLGRILRRFLEATVRISRPGDTTPELVRHLEAAGFEAADLERLRGLLRRWDAIKFARLGSDALEAERCEEAVRELVLRRGRPPRAEVA